MASDDQQPKGPRPDGGDGGPPRSPVRLTRGAFSWIVIFGLALMLLMVLQQRGGGANKISITNFWTHVGNGDIKSLTVKEELVTGELKIALPDSQNKAFECPYPGLAENFEEFRKEINRVAREPIEVVYQPSNNLLMNVLLSLIPWVLLIGIIWFVLFRQLRQSGGGGGMLGNFGRSRHRITTKEHTNVTFADVAGVEDAKEEVAEIIEFLKAPKRFQRLGGRTPRGVLLVGEPGCGKTMLAKAIAGEADVPFFSISGSDFVEMFVGVGASRVRDLFRQAKENSPCIIFLDEIDAVGRRRGQGYNGGGGHDEREQTLNAILVEMDGFETNDQVIVVAATNRADVLDPALVRPGRFDRQVFVSLPDVKGRFEILKVHAKKVKIQPPLDPKLHRIARGTPMFSGADLAAIINEAALLATMASKEAVDLDDLEEARDKVRWGRAKRSRVVEDKDRALTAYHEAGHAVVQSVLEDADPVHKVSIIPRGPYGGATFSLPEKDRMTVNRSFVDATLRVLCAGRIAEEIFGHDTNSGAEGDIRQATQTARHMITDWGMSERLGFVYYGDAAASARAPAEFSLSKDFSDKTAEAIDAEVKRIIDEAYADTRRIIEGNREKLEAVAQALLKYETLDGEEIRRLIAGETLDRPTVADLIAAEQDRRQPASPMARPIEQPHDGEIGPLPSPA
ncbi:MAG: ATP-dependent zinc metalloprotease FtsH [Planctomycetes bacterium]|nr:ATP-dependent zinc metalloprotease FtsH [Planctomycetota bacterium]